jgi:hypothetical protein
MNGRGRRPVPILIETLAIVMIELLKNWPVGEPVPAISLRQPWATAVLFYDKDVENRSRWPFKHRGPLVIHASKSIPRRDDLELFVKCAREEGVEDELLDMFSTGSYPSSFPFGYIVGVADLADVFGPEDELADDHPVFASPWASEEAKYWLYLKDVMPVKPVPFKGFVGMFKVPYDVAACLAPPTNDADFWISQ